MKAVGKASVVPVCFAVNEPLLFATPIILNPYFFIPFLVTPILNVCIFKFFVDVIGMNSFMYVLPWATPAPLGLVLGTGFSIWAFLLVAVLLVVDFVIYYPFFKAYDSELLAKEKEQLEEEKDAVVSQEVAATTSNEEIAVAQTVAQRKNIENTNVLVLCAGAGTSAMLANALTEGAKETNVPITSTAGAYGSHYEIMKDFDMIILAPQVGSYYDDIKKDTDRLGIKLVATKGSEYIGLTRAPKKAVEFVMSQVS